MALVFIVLLILLGLLLLVLEVLVVPGGILGILSVGMMVFGVYRIYEVYGTTNGNIGLVSTLLLSAIVVYTSLKSGAWKRLANKHVLEGKASYLDEEVLVGDTGIAVSDIRPMGNALFKDEKVEVTSEGEKIPVHSKLQVIRVEGHKIYVKKI